MEKGHCQRKTVCAVVLAPSSKGRDANRRECLVEHGGTNWSCESWIAIKHSQACGLEHILTFKCLPTEVFRYKSWCS